MRRATYQRIQGKRYTYQIRYDHAGYEVSRNGQIKKIGLVPKTLDEPYLSRDEAVRTVFVATITREEVDRLTVAYQIEIDRLQDEIDEFNAITRIPLTA